MSKQINWDALYKWGEDFSCRAITRSPWHKKTVIKFLQACGYDVTERKVRVDNPKKKGRIFISQPKERYSLEFKVKKQGREFTFLAWLPFASQLSSFLHREKKHN